jgi:hypothetical protein
MVLQDVEREKSDCSIQYCLTRAACCVQINLDSEEDEARGSQQSEQPAALPPPQQSDEAEIPALPQPERRRSAVQLDPAVQEILEKNKRAIAEMTRAAEYDPDGGSCQLLPACSIPACHVMYQAPRVNLNRMCRL